MIKIQIASPDVFPKEPRGNESPDAIFQSVGFALTMWESLQTALAYLFISAIGATFKFPVMRAFGHNMLVLTKLQMIEYAVDVSLHFHEDLNKRVVKFLDSVRGYNERRNDIAHGQVRKYQNGYYLTPSLTTSKKYHPWSDDKQELSKPIYCWTSAQIDCYRLAFTGLEDQCFNLRIALDRVTREYAQIEADELLKQKSLLGKSPSAEEP